MENHVKPFITGGVALITLAIIVLLGIAFADSFGYQCRDTGSVEGDTWLIGDNETPQTISFPYMQEGAVCIWDDGLGEVGDYRENTDWEILSSGPVNSEVININMTLEGYTAECNYTYLKESGCTEGANLFAYALAIFGVFAAVIGLSLIGKGIIKVFQGGQ